jgi:hypothetical protein
MLSLKFEAFLEDIVRKQPSSCEVRRNVMLVKDGIRRQADITYCQAAGSRIYRIVVEAKYSSNGIVHDTFKSPRVRKTGNGEKVIPGPFEQLLDVREFGEFDYAILATNSKFDERIMNKASRAKGVKLIEHDDIQGFYKKLLHGTLDINQAIESYVSYNRRTSVIYLA